MSLTLCVSVHARAASGTACVRCRDHIFWMCCQLLLSLIEDRDHMTTFLRKTELHLSKVRNCPCRAAHAHHYDLHQPIATDAQHAAVPDDATVAMNLVLDQVLLT